MQKFRLLVVIISIIVIIFKRCEVNLDIFTIYAKLFCKFESNDFGAILIIGQTENTSYHTKSMHLFQKHQRCCFYFKVDQIAILAKACDESCPIDICIRTLLLHPVLVSANIVHLLNYKLKWHIWTQLENGSVFILNHRFQASFYQPVLKVYFRLQRRFKLLSYDSGLLFEIKEVRQL